MGLLDQFSALPAEQQQAINSGLLSMAGALLTPQWKGGGMGAAFQAFPAAIDRAQQQSRQNKMLTLQEQQIGLQTDEAKRKAEAQARQQAALAKLLSDPAFANNPAAAALLGIGQADKAVERAYPAPQKPTFQTWYENGQQRSGFVAPGQAPQPVGEAKPPDMNQYLIPDGKGGWMVNQAYIDARKSVAREGAPRVNNIIPGKNDPNWGEPPKDMVWARDQSGNIIVQRDATSGAFAPLALPVAGSKTGQEIDSAARQKQASIATTADSISVLDKAIGHPGRSTASGVSGYLDPRNYIAGTDARNFQALLAQIKGKTFLQAFDTLKGGGQITEVEGKKATDAIARLDTAQSDEEFKSALQELRGIMAKGYERLAHKPYSPPENKDPLGVRAGKSAGDDPLGIR